MKTYVLLFILLISCNAFATYDAQGNLDSLPEANDIIVDVLQPKVLAHLDKPGVFSLATVLKAQNEERSLAASPNMTIGLSLAQLTKASSLYRSLADIVTQDINDIKNNVDVKLAYSSAHAETIAAAGNVGRHFDTHWLASSYAAFPLVAVINRMDKKDFTHSGCGDLRFIYRLSYRKRSTTAQAVEFKSSLPVFINVVYRYNASDCKALAKQWKMSTASLEPKAYADWLMQAPLNKQKNTIEFAQLELNMQAVRFPSGLKTHFGGQAIYLLRIFTATNNRLEPKLLENTPNVSKIINTPALKKELLEKLTEPNNIQKIDQGLFVLDDKFLTDRALSFSTTGRSRMANKPFSSIFMGYDSNATTGGESQWQRFVAPEDRERLMSIKVNDLDYIKSPAGIIERMNNRSCTGCHQSGGTAGFHMLGMASKLNSSFNQVTLPFSPHYYTERSRRAEYIESLIQGQQPNTFRPHSNFPLADWSSSSSIPIFKKAAVKEFCLAENNGHFPGISCKESYSECKITAKNERVGVQFGECVIKKKAPEHLFAGHVCREGIITNYPSYKPEFSAKPSSNLPYNLMNYKDIINSFDKASIPQSIYGGRGCANSKGGVPLGRISKRCAANSTEGRLTFVDQLTPKDLSKLPKDYCAMIGGVHFDLCAASDNPIDCLSNTPVRRSKLDTCHLGSFCREDYICQQLPIETAKDYTGVQKSPVEQRIKTLQSLNIGFCTPNYFVFNMRVDGHILPEKTEALENGFVYLENIDSSIKQDMRYATDHNFTGKAVPGYMANKCIIKKPVAEALSRAQAALKAQSSQLSLKVLDCYRPQQAVDAFVKWSNNGHITKANKKYFPDFTDKTKLIEQSYISPSSSHSKGLTVDITIVDAKQVKLKHDDGAGYGNCDQNNRMPDGSINMGSSFDCFDSISHTASQQVSKEAQENRKLLLNIMHSQGFVNYKKEWWHFRYNNIPAGKKYYNFPIQ